MKLTRPSSPGACRVLFFLVPIVLVAALPRVAFAQTKPLDPLVPFSPISAAGSEQLACTAVPKSQETCKAHVLTSYSNLPLSFEANSGQADDRVQFLARGGGYSLLLTSTEVVLALSKPSAAVNAMVRMSLVHAKPLQGVGVNELPGRVKYFLGNDPRKWRTRIPTYQRVAYRQVYSGIDVVYFGNQRQLEYDFVVAPGADPDVIKLSFQGVRKLKIDAQGNLALDTTAGQILQRKPFIYQEINGSKRAIRGGYVLQGRHQVGFQVGEYDTTRPLVIDPVLAVSTYLGGNGFDIANGMALDSDGNVYITGFTNSTNFPTASALQPGLNGIFNAYITMFNGSGLVYST
jgi:hypothetical protein